MPTNDVHGFPRILFVTSHWPLAPAYGAQQRVLNLARLLSKFANLSFVVVPTEVEDEETARRTSEQFNVCKVIRPRKVTPDKLLYRLPERLRHEFDPKYLDTDPYEISASDRSSLNDLICRHDLVWIHTIRTANWFRIYRWPHSVLDVDDRQSQTHQSVAESCRNPLMRLLNRRRAWIWRRRETTFRERFDALTVCSEQDRRYFGGGEQVHVIPNGACPFLARPRRISDPPRIGFIGNCEFMPNEHGLKWFIREVWPAIKPKFPNVQLRLVGRASDGHVVKMGQDIKGLGWVADPADEISTWSAMIVPVRIGGGTRVKLAEGFARKCPVVATSIGAFGYEVQNGRELLLADSAEDFALNCTRLLGDQTLAETIAANAHKIFLQRWTWDSFEGRVRAAVQKCLERSAAQVGNDAMAVPARTDFQTTRS
jgi:polysaccharide biosynthesis protein PslH